MERTLKKIIEIDEMTEQYRKQCDETKDKLKFELQEKLKQMNKEVQVRIDDYNRKITGQKIQEANELSKNIGQDKNKIIESVKQNYSNRKSELIKEIFNLIIKDSG